MLVSWARVTDCVVQLYQRVPEERSKMSEEGLPEVLVDRLRSLAAERDGRGCRDKDPNLDNLRYVATRLHQRATSQDKISKEKTVSVLRTRRPSLLSDVVSLIESTRDPAAMASLVGILKESVACDSRTQRGTVVAQLVALNASSALLRVLVTLPPKEVHAGETFVCDLVWLLSRLALRDAKFSVKVRSAGACKILHVVLRTQASGGKFLLPALHIFKVITKNPAVCAALAREGVAPTLEKILDSTGVLPSARLRLVLSVIANLCRTRSFLSRLCRGALLPLLLRPMSRWDNFAGRVRLRICQCALYSLQHAAASKAGSKALTACNGVPVLQRFCRLCPEDKAYDVLVSRVCQVLQQVAERRGPPVSDAVGPARFYHTVPDSSEMEELCFSDDSGDEGDVDYVDEVEDEDDDEEGELDEEEATSPGVRQELDSPVQSQRRESLDILSDHLQRRDSQDLSMYALFCRELLDSSFKSSEKGNAQSVDESPVSSLSALQGADSFCAVASRVHTVLRPCKVAYPDMMGGGCTGQLQPLSLRDRRVCRAKLLQCVDRVLQPGQLWNIVAYDLDRLIAVDSSKPQPPQEERSLRNDDEARLGVRPNSAANHLRFESRFESGNLRKAVQIGPREYELILSSDVNSAKHHQWFYFEVSNMDSEAPYVLNIVNNEKSNSQFNFGMQPVVYSVREATLGRGGWTHMGTDICYYRNSYQRPDARKSRARPYHTTTFSIKFPHSLDVCYVAYHYPYTYTQLLMQVLRWSRSVSDDVVFRAEPLCRTLNGNEVPLLTVTAKDTKQNPIQGRTLVYLTARVHPGESNSSHVIQGTLDVLLAASPICRALRANHVFKVIPMINVEGVVNGCHRCGLTNEDLNRRWSKPDPKLHPEVYHTKGLLEYLVRVLRRPPFVFIDFHGHSRKKNIFLYGCSRADSWSSSDRAQPDCPAEYVVLPQLLSLTAPAFSLSSCSYKVERGRESTARVTVWRQFGVPRTYTLEASYCGCDQGPYQGYQLSSAHLREVGANLCQALASLPEETERQRKLLPPGACSVTITTTSMAPLVFAKLAAGNLGAIAKTGTATRASAATSILPGRAAGAATAAGTAAVHVS